MGQSEMNMTGLPPTPTCDVTPERVSRMAEFAALPLPPERNEIVAGILAAWLPDATELSLKMSAASHQAIVPATVFVHAPSIGEEE